MARASGRMTKKALAVSSLSGEPDPKTRGRLVKEHERAEADDHAVKDPADLVPSFSRAGAVRKARKRTTSAARQTTAKKIRKMTKCGFQAEDRDRGDEEGGDEDRAEERAEEERHGPKQGVAPGAARGP